MLNILHINSFYSQRYFYDDFYSELEKHINNSIFIPVNKNFDNKKRYSSNVVVIKCYNDFDRLLFFSKQKKIYMNLKNYFAQNNFDLVHAHSLVSNGLGAYKLYKEFKSPYIVTVRATDIYFFIRFAIFLRPMIRKILVNASQIIFVSEALKKKFLRLLFVSNELLSKTQVIPNWVGEHYLEHREIKKITDDTIRILQISELIPRKNTHLTIKAYKHLYNQNYPLSLTIIGKPTSKKIFKMIKRQKNVEYIQKVDHNQIRSYYNEHDIFIMPSLKETFGIVYIEAASQGLPLIYTLDDGISGLEDGLQIGVAIKPNRLNIERAIIEIIQNYNHYSLQAMEFSKKFSLKKNIDEHLLIYLFVHERTINGKN